MYYVQLRGFLKTRFINMEHEFINKKKNPMCAQRRLRPALTSYVYSFFDAIMRTCPCNVHPITPHFYIIKLGLTRVYIFLIFALKHRLCVLVRTPSMRWCGSNVYPQSMFRAKTMKNIIFFHRKLSIIQTFKIAAYCIGMYA